MPHPIPVLETSRLVLSPLALSDAAGIQAGFPKWEIVRFLASTLPWPYPADGALTFIRDLALPAMADGSKWHWSIRTRDPADGLLGVISLMDLPEDNRGFWLDPAWQGRGLMTEASTAVTDFWFDVLGREVLYTSKAAANGPSCRLSERSGMRLVRETERDYVSGRLPGQIWEITREEWRARRAAAPLQLFPK